MKISVVGPGLSTIAFPGARRGCLNFHKIVTAAQATACWSIKLDAWWTADGSEVLCMSDAKKCRKACPLPILFEIDPGQCLMN